MAMITSRDTVVMKYKPCVILKLTLAIVAALLALSAALLFAIEIDNSDRNFIVSRGVSFYLQVSKYRIRWHRIADIIAVFSAFQIVLVVLSIGLAVMALYDVIFTLRPGGDPTLNIDTSAGQATTFNNPGFRDGRPGNHHSNQLQLIIFCIEILNNLFVYYRNVNISDRFIGEAVFGRFEWTRQHNVNEHNCNELIEWFKFINI